MLSSMQGISQTNLQQFQTYVPAAVSQAGASDPLCGSTATVLGTAIPTGDVGFSGSYY